MKKEKLIKVIKEAYTGYSFLYKGEYGYFDPEIEGEVFRVSYNADGIGYKFNSLEEFLSAPVFHGKTILEISDEISELEPIF